MNAMSKVALFGNKYSHCTKKVKSKHTINAFNIFLILNPFPVWRGPDIIREMALGP